MTTVQIHGATVNHNASAYTELMLRSLFARHPSRLDMSITVFDNGSQDDGLMALRAYVGDKGIPIIPSGFDPKTKWNSHGEVLSRFVLGHSDCTHYLFLDADVCFLEDNTIDTMIQELDADEMAFGIAPRISSNGENEIEEEHWPQVYDYRLHPCCALVRNTVVFRRVVAEIGLSCVQYLWAKGEEYLDTFRLMTLVMKTHGYRHLRSSRLVHHFFCVSYDWEPPETMEYKVGLRDRMLEAFREIRRGKSV